MGTLEDAVTDLQERVSALEAARDHLAGGTSDDPGAHRSATAPSSADVFWALDGLEARTGDLGGVLYTGSVPTPDGPVRWQLGTTASELLADDWSAGSAPVALAALGNPVRLRLLQALAQGDATVTELRALPDVGSTGQVYHHLHQLQAAGWVRQTGRGHYAVPPERLVPLLTAVLVSGRTA